MTNLFKYSTAVMLFLFPLTSWTFPTVQSLVYPGAKAYETPVLPPDGLRSQTLSYSGEKNIEIWSSSDDGKNKPTIIFLYGNGGNLKMFSEFLIDLKRLDVNIVAFDYPGYGKSDGPPSPETLTDAGMAALKWTSENFASSPIFLMGFSLGGGVAMQILNQDLISERKLISGVILLSTFTSLRAVADNAAQDSLLARLFASNINPDWYNSMAVAKAMSTVNLQVPIFLLHGTEDKTIPIAQARELRKAFGENLKGYLEIQNLTHQMPKFNEAEGPAWNSILEFMKKSIVPKSPISLPQGAAIAPEEPI